MPAVATPTTRDFAQEHPGEREGARMTRACKTQEQGSEEKGRIAGHAMTAAALLAVASPTKDGEMEENHTAHIQARK